MFDAIELRLLVLCLILVAIQSAVLAKSYLSGRAAHLLGQLDTFKTDRMLLHHIGTRYRKVTGVDVPAGLDISPEGEITQLSRSVRRRVVLELMVYLSTAALPTGVAIMLLGGG